MKWELIVDDAKFKEAMKRLKDPTPLNDMLEKSFRRALEIARKLTPGRGNVRREWATELTQDAAGRTILGVLKNNYKDPKILEYLEWGTRAHKIRPKNGGVLVFFSKSAIGTTFGKGKNKRTNTTGWVRTREVDHPGTKQYDIVGTTRKFLIGQIQQMKAEFLRKVVGGA